MCHRLKILGERRLKIDAALDVEERRRREKQRKEHKRQFLQQLQKAETYSSRQDKKAEIMH